MRDHITKRGEFGTYLYNLYKQSFSGSISVITKGNIHTLYLKDGKPIYIKEQKTTMPLGRVFVELGMIDNRIYDESLIEMARTGERQGEILLRKGFITKEQFQQAIISQFYKKSMKFFEISEGEIKIEENVPPPETGSENTVNISTLRLLYNGIKSLHKEHIIKLLPINANTIITRKKELDITLFSLPINAEETILIENIKGEIPYMQLLSLKITTDTEIAQLIYFLYLLELVEISTLNITDTVADPEGETIQLSGIYKPTFQKEEERSDEKTRMAPISTEEEIGWINELYSKYQTMDYFEFFGIETSSSRNELNEAYQKILKRLNTVKNAINIDEEISIKIDQITYFAEEAYSTLTSERSRDEYRSVVNAYYQRSTLDEGMAEMEFIRGEISLMKKDFPAALESFKKAIEYGGQRPEYISAYGIALYLNPEEPQRSRETLGKLYIKRALQQNPRSSNAYTYHILISCLEGKWREAEEIIQQGLQILPDNKMLKSLSEKITTLFLRRPISGEIRQALKEERKDSKGEELLRIFFEKKI